MGMVVLSLAPLLAVSLTFVPKAPEVAHLDVARQVVRDLSHDARVNEYGSNPTFLRWGHPTREARTVCGSFVTRLIERSYGLTAQEIHHWLGAGGTDAVDWWNVIAHEKGFRRLRRIDEIQPGDVLAIKYDDGSKDTGHVMVADDAPVPISAVSPLVSGTEQYRLAVIDSSASGHGPEDSRHRPGGGFGGIGRGFARLYADQKGRIVGYAWSETPKSTFYQAPERKLAIGRLLPRK